MTTRRKLSEISSFEVLLCLFVVMIHILSEGIGYYEKGTVLSFLYFGFSRALTFAVPGFVISAGIKFAHKYEHSTFNYFSFIKGRIIKIYIPYIIFAVIYYLYFVYYRDFFEFDLSKLGNYLWYGSLVAPFYFVILIMQFYVLSPIIMMFYRLLPQRAGILLAAVISILAVAFLNDYKYSDRIFLHYLIYWVIGCYIGSDFRTSMSRLLRLKKPLVIGGVFFTALYIGFSYANFCGAEASLASEIIKFIYCILASLMYLVSMPKSVGFLADHIAPATYYVFLVHCLVIFHIQYLLTEFGVSVIFIRLLITVFLTYILSLLLSVGYITLKHYILQIPIFNRRKSRRRTSYRKKRSRTYKGITR